MTQYLFFVALRYLPVGVALLIEFTAFVFVALWFRLFYASQRDGPCGSP